MAEILKLDLSSSCGSVEALESEQKNMGTQRISVSDHINAFQYTAEKTDSFVIDIDAFSSGINKDSTNANSRITLQRSLSRKGSQRGGDRKVSGNATLHDKDTVPAICSPKGPCTPEKPAAMAVGSTDHSINPHVHHQITITASNIKGTTTESKCITRRNSFRRSYTWAFDPKRVLLFFATLSSMGTILLIYFTLTINKQNADEYGGDWKQ
ncbi:uncharacterized protein LOC133299126 isoform X1 [Gastrolobium bilobum]|uniref:uncharacterized protein LOC133299126 isoform X1 n=1 Tax=Gastrolobium bilobum TaxID=150636 RepID=UPI002AAFBF6E|nr:uncharacterized protein LOC133299126 isoform X1 [Gastrolobium bilobum]